MKVFTVRNGKVSEGAKVERFALKGAGIEIDAVIIGEEGRGRERGVLPVQGETAGSVLRYAAIGQTKAGMPKLIAQPGPGDSTKCIVVFRTEGGFRGGASHTGDCHDEPCPHRGQLVEQWSRTCPDCGAAMREPLTDDRSPGVLLHPDVGTVRRWDDFPGEIICRGEIAQGIAGRMGGNEQIVAVLPAGVWFRTGYSGRLYGAPSAHHYRFDGERLIAVTRDERQVLAEVDA